MRVLPLLTATALLAGCAATAPDDPAAPARSAGKDERWRSARAVGEPVDCLNIARIRNTRVRDDRTIDFYTTGRDVYRNTLPYSCPSLGFERAFTYSTSLSQLCSVDIITVLYQAGGLQRGASCGLGKFQPVEGAPR